MSHNTQDDPSVTAEALIRELKRLKGAQCVKCRKPVCHHQVLMSFAFGFKSVPHCLDCFARQLNRHVEEIRHPLINYIFHHDCYRAAWDWATREENVEVIEIPVCLLASENSTVQNESELATPNSKPTEPLADYRDEPLAGTRLRAHCEWDAGEMACGDLVLELRLRLQSMQPGDILKVSARDLGAQEDLPAWCRLTGHNLLRAEPPDFWIKRKE